jgi:diguanylate cyclase (GGDEF)-like protein/PAS domain S-box-containing protein
MGTIEYASPSWQRVLGHTPEEVQGYNVLAFLHPDDTEPVTLLFQQAVDRRQSNTAMFRYQHKDGHYLWLESRGTVLVDEQDRVCGAVFGSSDITARMQAEQALRESQERYREIAVQNAHLYETERQRTQMLEVLRATMADISGELDLDSLLRAILERATGLLDAVNGVVGLYEVGADDLVILASHNLEPALEGTRYPLGAGVLGQAAVLRQLLVINTYAGWQEYVAAYDLLPDELPHAILAMPLLAGERLVGVIALGRSSLEHTFAPPDTELLEMFAQQATIAIQNARLFTEVQQLATTDPLMHIYNRRYFFELAYEIAEQAVHYRFPLAAVLLDIDNFKQINDTFGHQMGDDVLRVVGERCLSVLREKDIIGRYGGEEVIILLPNTSLNDAQQVAERLRHSLADDPLLIKGQQFYITASLGVASRFLASTLSLEALIDAADQMLYLAKRGGKNIVVIEQQDKSRAIEF